MSSTLSLDKLSFLDYKEDSLVLTVEYHLTLPMFWCIFLKENLDLGNSYFLSIVPKRT